MKKVKEAKKVDPKPIALETLIECFDDSEGAKNSMLMLGWTDNYSEFDIDKHRKGTVLFAGDKIIVQIADSREEGLSGRKRYILNYQNIIQELVKK